MSSESSTTRTEFHPSWVAWFWLLVFTLGLALPYVWVRRQATRYVVTDDRVIRHRGLISSSTDEFLLEDVTRIKTSRSLGDRLLGTGTIILDAGVDELRIAGVPNYDSVLATLRDAQDA